MRDRLPAPSDLYDVLNFLFIWINFGPARSVPPPQGAHTICLCNRCNFMADVLYLQLASSVVVYR